MTTTTTAKGKTGTIVAESAHQGGDIWSVNWSTSGTIVTGSQDRTVKAWWIVTSSSSSSSSSGEKEKKKRKTETKTSEGQGGSPVRVLKNVHTCKGYHKWGIVSTAMSPKDGDLIAASSLDSRLSLWDLKPSEGSERDENGVEMSSRPVQTIDVEPIECWSIDFSPSGDALVSGDSKGNVHVWDVSSRDQKPQKIATCETPVDVFAMCVRYAPNGEWIASGHCDGTVCVIRSSSKSDATTTTLEVGHTMKNAHRKTIRSLAFSKDSKRLVTAGDDRIVRVFDVASKTQIHELSGHNDTVVSIATHPIKSNIVATVAADCHVKIWDIERGACVHSILSLQRQRLNDVAWSPAGDQLACVGNRSGIEIHSIRLASS